MLDRDIGRRFLARIMDYLIFVPVILLFLAESCVFGRLGIQWLRRLCFSFFFFGNVINGAV